MTVIERSTTGRGGDTVAEPTGAPLASAATLHEGPAPSARNDARLAAATDRVMGFICDVLVAVESVHGLRGWGDAVAVFRQRRDATTHAPSRLASPEDNVRTNR